jgi:hypothetical protein
MRMIKTRSFSEGFGSLEADMQGGNQFWNYVASIVFMVKVRRARFSLPQLRRIRTWKAPAPPGEGLSLWSEPFARTGLFVVR